MTYPIGPKAQLVLDAAETYDRAAKAASAAMEALFGVKFEQPGESLLARRWRSRLDLAREMDAATETWLEWTVEDGEDWEDGRHSTARLGPTCYSVRYGPDGTYSATKSLSYSTGDETLAEREPTPESAQQACEDYVRQRGQFAQKEET